MRDGGRRGLHPHAHAHIWYICTLLCGAHVDFEPVGVKPASHEWVPYAQSGADESSSRRYHSSAVNHPRGGRGNDPPPLPQSKGEPELVLQSELLAWTRTGH